MVAAKRKEKSSKIIWTSTVRPAALHYSLTLDRAGEPGPRLGGDEVQAGQGDPEGGDARQASLRRGRLRATGEVSDAAAGKINDSYILWSGRPCVLVHSLLRLHSVFRAGRPDLPDCGNCAPRFITYYLVLQSQLITNFCPTSSQPDGPVLEIFQRSFSDACGV